MKNVNFRWLVIVLIAICGAALAPTLRAEAKPEAGKEAKEAAEGHGEHELKPGQPGDHEAEPAQQSVTQLLGSLMFWEYISFGLLLVILGGFVFPKLFKQLDARQQTIKDALDKAEQVRIEAEVLLKKHEEMMRRSHEDAKKITDEAIAAGRDARARIEQAANVAANELRERSQREVELMSKKVEAQLKDKAVELALEAASAVLKRSLTGEDHRRLARESIDAAAGMKN